MEIEEKRTKMEQERLKWRVKEDDDGEKEIEGTG
jgi:hypothetical protein